MRLFALPLLLLLLLVLLACLTEGKRGRGSALKSQKGGKSRRRSPGGSGGGKRRKAVLPVKQSFAKQAASAAKQLERAVRKTGSAAVSTSLRLRRELKQYFSSDFEVLLLKLTKPSDVRPVDADVDRFLNTIEEFVRDLDTTNPSNPYRVTLHKLWTKTSERSGYTVLKALFLLHTLLRYTQPEDAMIFKKVLLRMTREQCPRLGTRHWDAAAMATVDAETAHLSDFISRYAHYLAKRGRTFTASFEEMKLLHVGMRPEDVAAQMLKALKVLDAALLCRAAVHEECSVTMSCLELVARDLRELFLLFHSKLRFVVSEAALGDLFAAWPEAEVRAVLQHLKAYYNDRYEDIEAFLGEVADVLQLYDICIPVGLSTPQLFDDPTETRAGGAGGVRGSAAGSVGAGGDSSNFGDLGVASGALAAARESEAGGDTDLERAEAAAAAAAAAARADPQASDLGAQSEAADTQHQRQRQRGSSSSSDGGSVGRDLTDPPLPSAESPAAEPDSWDL